MDGLETATQLRIQHAREALSQAGDVLIAVPADQIEAPPIQSDTSPAVPAAFGIRA